MVLGSLQRYVGLPVAVVLLVLAGLVGHSAGAQRNGWLVVQNVVGSYSALASIENYDYSGISDGYDLYDHQVYFSSHTQLWPEVYVNNPFYPDKLGTDTRPNSTLNDTFDVELSFYGTISSARTNSLYFGFPTADTFDTEPITLQQTDASGNPIGSSYDVRAIIDGTLGGSLNPSAHQFNLPDLPAGGYDVNTPYAHYAITIDNSVPEPGSLVLLGIAAAGMLGWWRWQRPS
jgi:hypothetical protein